MAEKKDNNSIKDEGTKLDMKDFQTHSMKETMGNMKLLEAKANQLREFALHYNLAKSLNKDRPESPHIMIEAWQFAGWLMQLRGGESGYERIEGAVEAYSSWAEIVDADGNVVMRAESMCDRGESNWKSSNSYVLASMAVTRAQGKAWRMSIGFLPLMSGFSATPWEEMASLERDDQYTSKRPNAAKVEDPTALHGMTSDQFGNWVVTELNRNKFLDQVQNVNEFVKRAMETASLKWETAQKAQLEKAITDEITRTKAILAEAGATATTPATKAEEKPAKTEEAAETEHGMDMDQFGLWTQGLMDSVGLKINDMSPKGISEFVKLGLKHGKIDWFKSTEEELKAGIREYAEKVVAYAKEEGAEAK